jgi:hypothetical protein
MAKKTKVQKDAGYRMAGTEATYKYVVVSVTPRGRVGFRDLGNESYRVRVEPKKATAASMKVSFPRRFGWTQPGDGDQFRFSRVVQGDAALQKTVKGALKALQAVRVGKKAPAWAKGLVG